jgi:uncharacterized protein with ParB-like and HNH nuclease domain
MSSSFLYEILSLAPDTFRTKLELQMQIDSKDHEIRDLFAGSYFHIPRFQRPYSWPQENVQDFWDDVVGVQSDDYFLGSMVVYKDKPQRFGVVDVSMPTTRL